MDIVSHGLWGGAAFGRNSKKSFWSAFVLGILPDLVAFGPFFVGVFLGLTPRPQFDGGHPEADIMPTYVHQVYNISHSLVVFLAIFGLLWLIFRRPVWEFSAWGLHILFDIPVHTKEFFFTPYLWPFNHPIVDGVPWSHPAIFFSNWIALVLIYGFLYLRRKRSETLSS